MADFAEKDPENEQTNEDEDNGPAPVIAIFFFFLLNYYSLVISQLIA